MTTGTQRSPLALRVSVTDRCQLRCQYCMPADGITRLPRCEGCRRLRLTSDGRLLGCLARQEGSNVRPLLQTDSPRNTSQLMGIFDKALRLKQKGQNFAGQRPMVTIGG